MPWHEKNSKLLFDFEPINGLLYLDGDLIATLISESWTSGKKFPIIKFPSGLDFDVIEIEEKLGIILFEGISIPLHCQIDIAFETLEAKGCGVVIKDNSTLELDTTEDNLFLELIFNTSQLIDIREI